MDGGREGEWEGGRDTRRGEGKEGESVGSEGGRECGMDVCSAHRSTYRRVSKIS